MQTRNLKHSLGHIDCPACKGLRDMHTSAISANLSFFDASDLYLRLRTLESLPVNSSARFVSKDTMKCYEQYTRSLNLFFAAIPLREIHAGHLRAYQHARLTGDEPFIRKRRPHEEPGPCPAGPLLINHELTFLKMIMSRAGAWTPEIQKDYEPFKFDELDVPRAMTPDEQHCWLEVSKLNPRWELIHLYSVVAFATCCNPKELLTARLGNVNLFHQVFTVSSRSAKNRHRMRTIPLVDPDVLWAFEKLIERARACGATDPQHYLFPFRKNGKNGRYIPEKPATNSLLKKEWYELCRATGLVDEKGKPRLRRYDTRHTAITRLAEAGLPLDTIMSMSGHISVRMHQHYTQISDQAKVQALRMAQTRNKPERKPKVEQIPDWRLMKVANRRVM